jgi:hypothetical protein
MGRGVWVVLSTYKEVGPLFIFWFCKFNRLNSKGKVAKMRFLNSLADIALACAAAHLVHGAAIGAKPKMLIRAGEQERALLQDLVRQKINSHLSPNCWGKSY